MVGSVLVATPGSVHRLRLKLRVRVRVRVRLGGGVLRLRLGGGVGESVLVATPD